MDFRPEASSEKEHPNSSLVITKNLHILNNLNQLNPQCRVRKIIYHMRRIQYVSAIDRAQFYFILFTII
jgi:hypothetical protein